MPPLRQILFLRIAQHMILQAGDSIMKVAHGIHGMDLMQCGITTRLTSLIVIHIIFVIAQIILLVMDGNAVIILVELCILTDAVHGTMLMMDLIPGVRGKGSLLTVGRCQQINTLDLEA